MIHSCCENKFLYIHRIVAFVRLEISNLSPPDARLQTTRANEQIVTFLPPNGGGYLNLGPDPGF